MVIEALQNLASKNDLQVLKSEILTSVRSNSGCQPDQTKPGLSLGHVIRLIYDTRCPEIKPEDVNFVFDEFLFKPIFDDASIEDVKREFVDRFGRETARRLLWRVMKMEKLSLQGFTEEEMFNTCFSTIIDMVLLLHHEEIGTDEMAFRVLLSADGSEFTFQNVKYKPV